MPMDDAVTAATAAGFRVTPRSGPSRVHVQRNLWTAATIRPTHGGVVVKPAWTPAQIAVVIVVLALLLCGGGVL
ncbi:hypothetical protein DVH21_02050 [Micromonospora aurantiaca]|uniref:Uncharacterized protein n=1 Tax=Micromonospora aurantiaca (nom. illeg.) TaxID=47850 RepID=A0A6N3JV78_9ACTN|nr:hypothetical protein DVH21_02050 [Micromonospora aurantiaca]